MKKQEINISNLWNFKIKHKFTEKDFMLLLEAFRRKHFLNIGSYLRRNDDCLGLGSPTRYRSKFFKPAYSETPYAPNWYKLTDEGVAALKLFEKNFYYSKPKTKKERKERDKVHELIVNFIN